MYVCSTIDRVGNYVCMYKDSIDNRLHCMYVCLYVDTFYKSNTVCM